MTVGFLSAQRFALPPISAYACLLPLAVAIAGWRDQPLRNLMIFLALLAKVDSSDVAYENTPAMIRLAIYAVSLWALVGPIRATPNLATAVALYIAVLAVTTLPALRGADSYTLTRDFITLFIFLAIVLVHRGATATIDVRAVCAFAGGLLVSELVNIAFFYDPSGGDYLSYDSLKCLVAFGSLYALATRRPLLALVLIGVSLLVIVNYATRMLLVSYLVALAAVAFGGSRTVRERFVLAALFGLVAAVLVLVLEDAWVEGSRVFSLVLAARDSLSIGDYLRLLDPVRYAEHQLFFERDILAIVFGDGLGSGFDDVNGVFAGVPYDSGAFSDRELNEGRFFRLHDAWIFFGLRFGLIWVLLCYGLLFREMFGRSRRRALLGCWTFMMINNATFSIAGLIATGILAQQLWASSARRPSAEAGADTADGRSALTWRAR